MPSIHIKDSVFADYLMANDGDASAAKQQMQKVVEDNAPDPDK